MIRSLFSEASIEEIDTLLTESVPEPDYADTVERVNRLGEMGMNFLVGSLFNSILFSLLCYTVLRYVLKRYRHVFLRKLRS